MQLALDPFNLIIIFVSLVIAISIHEMMHAWVGLKLGDTTAQEEGRISLNPLRHIDPFLTLVLPIITLLTFGAPVLAAKPVPFNPDRVKFDELGAAMIAFAGPLVNLLLAVVAAVMMQFINDAGILNILFIFLSLNIALFVFNMLPIPPLDGSRILYAVAPDAVRSVMAQIEQFGIIIVFALIFFVPGFHEVIVNLNNALLTFLL